MIKQLLLPLLTLCVLHITSVIPADPNPFGVVPGTPMNITEVPDIQELARDISIELAARTEVNINQKPIRIKRLDKNYLRLAKAATATMSKDMKSAIARLFNHIETIDDNLSAYLNNPTASTKELLDGALASCAKVKKAFTNILQNARGQKDEEVRRAASAFIVIAEQVIATTENIMRKVPAPKKPSLFRRLRGG